MYIWGRDWQHAKTQAECYHYLFEASVRMAQLGFDASASSGAAPALTPSGIAERVRGDASVGAHGEPSDAPSIGRMAVLLGGVK